MAAASFTAPLWASAFRPFYLAGALYAPLAMVGGAGALAQAVDLPSAGIAPSLWHAHEMIFGFAVAIIVGTVLTALPSWAGTEEIAGRRLALLAALWLAGRLAFWLAPWLPPWSVALADVLLLPVLCALLLPQLARVRDRRYLWLLPVLLALAAAGIAFHLCLLSGDAAGALRALHGAVYVVMLLFVLKGGVLTPVFTATALRELGRGDLPPFRIALEVAAAGSVVLLALLDLGGAPRPWVGAAAAAAALVHALRTARWRGWRVADQPLLAAMHLGFAWLIAALALHAAGSLTDLVPAEAWLHAFTVGALGMMMLGLMTRVVLRHTGRPLAAPPATRLALLLAFVAALLRLAATVHGLGSVVVALAAVLWAAAFLLYLGRFGAYLAGASLPRA
jgi:uncharacterized protein involved in response to NO